VGHCIFDMVAKATTSGQIALVAPELGLLGVHLNYVCYPGSMLTALETLMDHLG